MSTYIKTETGVTPLDTSLRVTNLENNLTALQNNFVANVNALVEYDKEFLSTDDKTGGSFGYNFLYVDTTKRDSIVNKNSFWGSNDVYNVFVNYPPTMPSECYGLREVYWCDYRDILVKITETSPLTGRQYFNYYVGTKWLGWKTLTPS